MMYEDNVCPLACYEELEPLGGKDHVWLVRNREDGQLYVKKRVKSYAPEVYHRLRSEPVANTPRIFGIYEDPEPQMLVLIEEYIPGRTLAERLNSKGPLSAYRTVCIGIGLCDILKELHRRKPAIIHRDIKPSNVMLLPDGSVRLLDFGAAKLAVRERRDTVLMGTAGYAAPEQYGFSASTPQTDIYALGVLLNTLCTGALPWEQRAKGQLGRIIDRCIQLEPMDRYPSAAALRRDLNGSKLERIPWLPPGFRSQRWYKAVPALFYYVLLYQFSFGQIGSLVMGHGFGDALLIAFTGLLPVVFYCNYLGVQRFFPLMRSRRWWARLLGLLISPFWLANLYYVAFHLIRAVFGLSY